MLFVDNTSVSSQLRLTIFQSRYLSKPLFTGYCIEHHPLFFPQQDNGIVQLYGNFQNQNAINQNARRKRPIGVPTTSPNCLFIQ